MHLNFVKLVLDRRKDLAGVAGAARHRWDRLARGLTDDVIEQALILGHGTAGEQPAARLEHTVHLTDGEGDIDGVINGKAAGDQVELIIIKEKRVLKSNSMNLMRPPVVAFS